MGEVYELARDYHTIRYMVIEDNWERKARCKGEDTNIFLDPGREQEAKKYCNECEVKNDCLSYALKQPGTIGGMYGGFSDLNRNRAYRIHLKIRKEPVSV